jgi:hypothetical protein
MARILRFLLATIFMAVGLPAQAAAPVVLGYMAEQPAINKTRFIILFDAPIENLDAGDFALSSGCSFAYLEILDATAQVELVDCPTGRVLLTLKGNSMGSTTLGPDHDESFEIEIDATAPTATFSEIQLAGNGPFSYTTQLRFSEAVEFDAARLIFSSTGQCESKVTAVPGGLDLQADCGYSELSWTLPARSLSDSYGNLGPYRDLKVSLAKLAPTATPTPTPTPTPSPNPTPTPAPNPPVIPIPIPTPIEVAPVIPVPQSPSPMEILPPIAIAPSISLEVLPATTSDSVEVAIEDGFVFEHVPLFAFPQLPIGLSESVKPVAQTQDSSTLSQLTTERNLSAIDDVQPKVELTAAPASGKPVEFRAADNSIGVWLIGAGSMSLILLGLYRRVSGR